MKNIVRKREPEEFTFWQSYSDMMAALLLLFVLIIAFAVSMMQKATETYWKKNAELDQAKLKYSMLQNMVEEQKKKLEIQQKAFEEQQIKLEEQQVKLEKQKEAFDEQQVQLDKLIGIRKELIEKLRKVFEGTSMGLAVDSETGAISFDSKILFDFNKYELKESGVHFLNEFFPKYFEIILDEGISSYVAEVIIEGHTDNSGTYLYNLDLSQKRAFAVAEYCLRDDTKMFTGKKLDTIRQLVTANGRSYYELKYDNNGNVDLAASRRVEIKFRLKEDEMIKEMSAILERK